MKTNRSLHPAFLAIALAILVIPSAFAQQSTPPPPPPPPPAVKSAPSKAPTKPVKIGGEVMSAKRIDHTVPVYPADAHVSGKVILKVTVSKAGLVTDETVISSDSPLLTASALDAVRKFRYAPTLLNGEPISVLTTVTVVYDLNSKPKS
jgi:periplasmic protein TonB